MKLYTYILFIIFVFSISTNSLYAVKLQKPKSQIIYGYSGDEQTQTIGKVTENPLRVLVTDNDGNPLFNYELHFEIISYPNNAKNFKIKKELVLSDSLGIVENHFKLGDKEGVYEILVSSKSDCDSNILVYEINGRKKTWIGYLVMGVLGGLALFLYGMTQLSKGMQATAGNKMRKMLSSFSKNRFLSFFAGILLTVIVQSSTATSVMLVGFVEAGLMSFANTLGMLLGAGVGTTITAQLIAFKITDFSMAFIAIGFGFILFSNNIKLNNIGKTILGFGLLFFGMYIMSSAMAPLRNYDGFLKFLVKLENPFIGILAGFLFTALIQSSAAFIGILITIASQGFLSLDASIPLILGTSLGTGLTAIIASISSGAEAQKVAFANIFFKLIGILLFVWWIPEWSELIKYISPKAPDNITGYEALSMTVPRQIANAHTVFSIGLSIIILPFINLFAKLIDKYIFPRISKKKDDSYKLKYINSAITSSPAIALSLAKQETERMSQIVKNMVNLCLTPFFDRNKGNTLKELQKLENESDFLRENINGYLISVSAENSDEQRLREAFQIMYVVKELEMIADIVNTNIRHQAEKWLNNDAEFSNQGKVELESLQLKALKQISRSMEVFKDINLEKAEYVKQKFKKYSQLAEDYEMYHYERLLSNNEHTRESSEVHLEIIGLLNAINRHATNIARIIIKWQ